MNPQDIAHLLELTSSPDAKIRKAALLELCPCHVRANKSDVWQRILQMLSDEDAGVRSIVLHNLCDGSPRELESQVVAAVEQLANDADKKLRRRARRALAAYRRTGVINVE